MAHGRYLPVVQQHPYEYDPYDEWERRKLSWNIFLSSRDVNWSQHHNLCLSLISGILSRAMAHSSLGTHWSFVLCSKVHLTNASNCFSKFLYGHCTGQEYVSTPYFLGSILYYSFISVFDYVLFVLITYLIHGTSLFECSSDQRDELFLQVPLWVLHWSRICFKVIYFVVWPICLHSFTLGFDDLIFYSRMLYLMMYIF